MPLWLQVSSKKVINNALTKDHLTASPENGVVSKDANGRSSAKTGLRKRSHQNASKSLREKPGGKCCVVM